MPVAQPIVPIITFAGDPSMSSREIADLTGSTHDNVLKTIRALVERGVVSGNETPYVHPQNGQTYSEFRLDFRNTMIVVSGYSPELRARIIDRWQQLETERQTFDPATILENPAAMRGLLLTYTEKVIALEAKVEDMRDDVAAHERLTRADGSLNITEAAKNLGIRPKDLFDWLAHNGWIYKRAGSAAWLGYQDKCNRGLLEHKSTTVLRSDGSEKITEQVRVTPKGLSVLAKLVKPIASLVA
jgi:phage antirepressor YoqD-like protein/phage regulator Rha-like protein